MHSNGVNETKNPVKSSHNDQPVVVTVIVFEVVLWQQQQQQEDYGLGLASRIQSEGVSRSGQIVVLIQSKDRSRLIQTLVVSNQTLQTKQQLRSAMRHSTGNHLNQVGSSPGWP